MKIFYMIHSRHIIDYIFVFFFCRATVLETTDTWYMDDPNLIINICQDSKVEADDQGPTLPECCACDEAKFEVTFEGLWSRNTHPKVCK